MPVKLIDTHEDAVNIHLPQTLPYHLPYNMLRQYYRGEIHRPPGVVGEGKPTDGTVGHYLLSITGMFGDGQLSPPFDQGLWIGNYKYPCEESLGMHMRGDRDQEFLICGIESINCQRPYPSLVRNFTEMTDLKVPTVSHGTVAKVHGWREKIAANLPKIEHSWGDHPGSKQVIYVGSGPGLVRNGAELLKLDYSKTQVWAANEAFSYLSGLGVPVDCFFCIDSTSPERWWKDIDCSDTCLVTTAFVNPEILKANWKKVYWFNVAGDGFYYNLVRKHKPHLAEVDATLGVGSAMIESTWMKGARRVVLAGCDFCYRFDEAEQVVYRSVKHRTPRAEWGKFVSEYAHFLVRDQAGKASMTYLGLALEASAVFGAAMCLAEKQVEVVNASEGGILFLNPRASYVQKWQEKNGRKVMEHSSLRESVARLNLGLDSGASLR